MSSKAMAAMDSDCWRTLSSVFCFIFSSLLTASIPFTDRILRTLCCSLPISICFSRSCDLYYGFWVNILNLHCIMIYSVLLYPTKSWYKAKKPGVAFQKGRHKYKFWFKSLSRSFWKGGRFFSLRIHVWLTIFGDSVCSIYSIQKALLTPLIRVQ